MSGPPGWMRDADTVNYPIAGGPSARYVQLAAGAFPLATAREAAGYAA